MSIYDNREQAAYGSTDTDPAYCENPYILKWWSDVHDHLIAREILEKQWVWAWGISEKIVTISPRDVIASWRAADPLCLKYAWYNILMYFAISRAQKLGLTGGIRAPVWKSCPLCDLEFIESSLPVPLVERLGIDQLDFCAPCLKNLMLQNTGNDTSSKEEALTYLRDLAQLIKRIPSQDFGSGMYDLRGMSTDERLAVLQILKHKPTQRRVKDLFGSWFKALIAAELLDEGARRTSLGTQCLARDGHMCFSLGEKTIDDLLFALGIPHEREPVYPEGNYRADFLVNGAFIEYFGLAGDAEYDAKTKRKKQLCETHGIRLVSILPRDLVSSKKLESILLTYLEPRVGSLLELLPQSTPKQ
jgi:hypothetical protein